MKDFIKTFEAIAMPIAILLILILVIFTQIQLHQLRHLSEPITTASYKDVSVSTSDLNNLHIDSSYIKTSSSEVLNNVKIKNCLSKSGEIVCFVLTDIFNRDTKRMYLDRARELHLKRVGNKYQVESSYSYE